ncbi:uncharacterized protein MYCFIDRAFT_176738 [Pseudocercospora fijiensis CIRAD86]|uniref:Uncharacterized protein n=1 Tax=Pseudocercospora fijiensis (strain CIRAD86) TaxID=383855 RepID=M3AA04_PSEFD|nr:uncharacterized protein MYCFIDRAFT_176738 [Pseudocercospora fijiensis CIRAD86]EME81461.1 hypothetical protein MYCFIDRAFT_176738 [Pseudocercospora fijiensis CIRAD86]
MEYPTSKYTHPNWALRSLASRSNCSHNRHIGLHMHSTANPRFWKELLGIYPFRSPQFSAQCHAAGAWPDDTPACGAKAGQELRGMDKSDVSTRRAASLLVACYVSWTGARVTGQDDNTMLVLATPSARVLCLHGPNNQFTAWLENIIDANKLHYATSDWRPGSKRTDQAASHQCELPVPAQTMAGGSALFLDKVLLHRFADKMLPIQRHDMFQVISPMPAPGTPVTALLSSPPRYLNVVHIGHNWNASIFMAAALNQPQTLEMVDDNACYGCNGASPAKNHCLGRCHVVPCRPFVDMKVQNWASPSSATVRNTVRSYDELRISYSSLANDRILRKLSRDFSSISSHLEQPENTSSPISKSGNHSVVPATEAPPHSGRSEIDDPSLISTSLPGIPSQIRPSCRSSAMDPEYFNQAFLPTSRNHRNPPVSHLLNLPFELRHRILIHALKQKGSIELQYPVWASLQVFDQPLFQTCRSLRTEAVQAFYEVRDCKDLATKHIILTRSRPLKVNDFLWVIDVENKSRSDPSTYPTCPASTGKLRQASPKNYAYTIPNCLPWEYPDLMRRLRHLQINIYLPSNDQNTSLLQDRLSALVQSLDRGRRLAILHVLVTAKRRAAQIPLSQDEVLALEVLAGMQVRGKVDRECVAAGEEDERLKYREILGLNLHLSAF